MSQGRGRSVWIAVAALLLAVLGGFSAAQTVYAATIQVNTTLPGVRDDGKCSLAEAILAANSNTGGVTNDCTPGDDSPLDTIVLVGTTYPLTGTFEASDAGLPPVASRIVISGNGATITRQSADIFRILEIANTGDLALYDTTLSKGQTAIGGGGIYNGNRLALHNSRILANSAGTYGGGIYGVASSNTLIDSSQIVSNSAGSYGGGIYSVASSNTLIDSSQIVSNSTGNYGGGIYSSGVVTITTSAILSNSATSNGGGAVASNNATMTLSDTDVLTNYAGFNGGGLYGEFSSLLTVNNSRVNNNSAYQGGGILSVLGFLQVNDTELHHNTARTSAGGGIFNDAGNIAAITVSRVVSNSASNDGGGIFNNVDATMTVTGGEIRLNYSEATGGGIANFGNSLTVSHTVIASNRATGIGGAVAQTGSGTRIEQSCIMDNSELAVSAVNTTTVDAPNNFWGASNGPSGAGHGDGDGVGDMVNYTPFLPNATSACPGLALEAKLVADRSQAQPGEVIHFTAFITNVGTVNLVSVEGTDAKAGASFSTPALAAGAAISPAITYAYTVTVGDLATGVVTNTLVVTGTDVTSKTVVVSQTLETPVVPNRVRLPSVQQNEEDLR